MTAGRGGAGAAGGGGGGRAATRAASRVARRAAYMTATGATDLRDKCGSAAGKQIIVQRGRWCATDIDEIYSRASLGEHVAASVDSRGSARIGTVGGW